MATVAKLYYVENDDDPVVTFRWTGQDLNIYTSITGKFQRSDGSRVEHAMVVDATDAEVATFTWQPGDLVRGEHELEFEFLQSSGKKFTLPRESAVIISVREDKG
jgi:hypothetical protein